MDEQRGDDASLYLEKATGGAMQGALPETSAPNPMGRRFAWKQEGAALSPGRRLLKKLTFLDFLLNNIEYI